MEDAPFIRFLTFIKSGQPADNLSSEQLREFLTVKPERMGLDYPKRWEQLRINAVRILAARDEDRRHRELIDVTTIKAKREEEHTLLAWWSLAKFAERVGMVAFGVSLVVFGFLCAKMNFISRVIDLVRDVIP